MTRKIALLLNSIVVLFFTCFTIYTFFAKEHLENLARDYVTQKTIKLSQPAVDAASKAIESPAAQKLLSAEHQAIINKEIGQYQRDPVSYVTDLTTRSQNKPSAATDSLVLKKLASIKEKIRGYYNDTLAELIFDLRIFSISNLVFGLFALILAYRSRTAFSRPLLIVSILMFVSVIYCSYLYIDDLTFFRIMARTHMGWYYPVLLAIVSIRLCKTYREVSALSETQHSVFKSGK